MPPGSAHYVPVLKCFRYLFRDVSGGGGSVRVLVTLTTACHVISTERLVRDILHVTNRQPSRDGSRPRGLWGLFDFASECQQVSQ